MLLELHIRNFAIIKTVDISFENKLTGLTGETGAGKSILLDALNLVLGERASPDLIRPNEEMAEITAVFDAKKLKPVSNWLDKHSLSCDDECIIRRIVTKEGRSKAYINGTMVTLQQLKALGELLINIHGQHEHQKLTHPEEQLHLVDAFASPTPLYQEVKTIYQAIKTTQAQLKELQARSLQTDKLALLNYQIQSIDFLKCPFI